ncbi:RNA polymerase associated protein RapA [Pseudoalteromonas luteoviolacea B = ATCC 29581]|nr:RNA polymerase associated protein RapA [Pseudoalteromonas luteoviolacea B = ATCC 29581]
MNFSLGQRWISDTESDLGLGTVVALEGRQVTILFPACGENRVYSMQEAPVTRVIFNPGDVIRSAEEWEMTVGSVEVQGDLLCYHGQRTDTEEAVSLKEVMLDHFIKFNKPQDRLFAGQVDRFDHYTLRYQSWQHRYEAERSPLKGLVGQRASLIPHQLYIAEEVGKRFAPRVLLSDEVGLGKTIEAGMILHQQILSGRANRVLIIVPENLQHQWLVEMLRRFNLRFSIFDEERCDEAFADSSNVFDTEQLVLVSLEFITKKRRWFEQATLTDWDLLIVDEAHHLTVEKDIPSLEYQRIAELSQDIPGLVLLTATPDQLGHRSHFARLQLLDPDRFYDYDQFVEEEAHYKDIADAANQLLQQGTLSDSAKQTLTNLLKESDINNLLNNVSLGDENAKQELLSMLLDRHGTGRILFRNSRSAITGYPSRKLNAYPLTMPKQYLTAINVLGTMSGLQNSEARARRALFPEKIFQEFEGEGSSWANFDPRVEWLIETLKDLKHEKVLLICAQADTAINLEQVLREKAGVKAAVFHEGMSIIERDRAAAYFADEYDSAQVLLCSEIGSEGRNFQFSHHLVLFDLPLNPDLLEQRIGRLDRIGQKHDVQIHVPYFADTAQEVLLRWYNEGLDAFEKTSTTGQLLYSSFSEELLEFIATHCCDEDNLDPLLEQAAKENAKLRKQMEQGRDRLLELHSSGQGRAELLANDIAELDDQTALPVYMIKVFDLFGVAQEDKGENTIILKPTEHMLNPSFPCLKDDGITVTFDRATALSQEDAHFISWDHPMVSGTFDMICDDDFGTASVALLKNKKLPPGTFFVELVYIAEASAPKALQLGRFLPPTPVRLLMDKAGNNLAANVPFDSFNQQLSAVGRQTASKLVNALQTSIHPLLIKGNDIADKQLVNLQCAAREQVSTELTEEQARLVALKAINPNIREEEISFFDKQQKQLLTHIEKAQMKLDAIRVIVVTHE